MGAYSGLRKQKLFTPRAGRGRLAVDPVEREAPGERPTGTAHDLRFREREEAFEGSPVGAFLYMEPPGCSPYDPPLTSETYRFDRDLGPSGLCPICNNSCAKELDAFYIENLYRPSLWKKYPFDHDTVLRHVIQHISVIYAAAGSRKGIESIRRGLVEGGAKRYTHTSDGTQKNDMRAEAAQELTRALREIRESIEHREREESAAIELPPSSSLGAPLAPTATVPGRPQGERAQGWYAFDGGEQRGALRLWGDKRVGTEIAKRSNDAIVLMDEMLDVRSMSRRIYSEIMDSDIDEANAEEEQAADAAGRKPRYIERNYGAAIQAVREIKSVAIEMAKLALIASKIGDEKGSMRQLSPAMNGLLAEIMGDKKDAEDATMTVIGSGDDDEDEE